MTTPRIYVGTYAKYNNGSIAGKWLDLDGYADKGEFLEACMELHSDEDDPELMFQDWEGIPDSIIGESHIDESFWDLMDAYDEHGEDAVNAYIACFGEWDKEEFLERYRGEFDSWERFAEGLVEDMGYHDEIPDHLRYYFDYEKYGRDLRISGDFTEHEGFYFWTC